MSVNFTVAIPTYNGEQRLPEVLEKLRECGWESDRLLPDLTWEIIIVDNNSSDRTAQVVQTFQTHWLPKYPLKYCFEPQQGAAFARRRAIQVAQGELIGFLDDDNLPAADWIIAAFLFAQDRPQVGAFGSQIHPLYETPPPENFERIAPFLAITERGSLPLKYQPSQKLLPPSAGLVVRRNAWLNSVPPNPILTGRTSQSMLTSEDLEMLSWMQQTGWEIWYNPAMQVWHKIPGSRLSRDYLIPFFRGIGLSRYVTRMFGFKSWQKPLALFAYTINDLRKILFHLLKYGTEVNRDLVTACELELFLSSLASPIYLWKNGYLKDKK
jgi:glycosyltransferase involved in cell wall biosynthesis